MKRESEEVSLPIGGYFELEMPRGELPCEGGVTVNFGRGGLELILRTRQYRKVWIPDYICPCVPAFLNAIGMPFSTYEIGANLEPRELPPLAWNEAFLYVNYFGVKDDYCDELEESRSNLILDLTQAFYYRPLNADGFNSTRKFFGVPDGGFAFGHRSLRRRAARVAFVRPVRGAAAPGGRRPRGRLCGVQAAGRGQGVVARREDVVSDEEAAFGNRPCDGASAASDELPLSPSSAGEDESASNRGGESGGAAGLSVSRRERRGAEEAADRRAGVLSDLLARDR